jgi:gamma-glutamyl phosphate reductase
MDIKQYMHTVGQQARAAAAVMARASTKAKNDTLSELANVCCSPPAFTAARSQRP